MHCIGISIVSEEELKRIKETRPDVHSVYLNQGFYALPDVKKKSVNGLYVSTDYFGFGGDQYSKLYKDGKKVQKFDSINEGLRAIGVVKEGDMDEFDTVHLGRYRSNDDFYETDKGTVDEFDQNNLAE